MLGALAYVGAPNGWRFFILGIIIHAMCIGMVLRSALARYSRLTQMLTGVATGFVLLFGVYVPLVALGSSVATAVQVNGVFRPGLIHNGDVLVCQGTFTRPRTFRRGDLVMYRIGSNVGPGFYVRSGYGVDRILGLPGDRVQMKRARLFVNGEPVPPDHLPLGVLSGISDFDITVGDRGYLILPSLFELHGLHYGNDQLRRDVLLAVALVPRADILGPVFWRLRPLSRFGPLH
jgi:signal peptidase I